MVTCTTPPFRAAVRLNSGVRAHREFIGRLENRAGQLRTVLVALRTLTA